MEATAVKKWDRTVDVVVVGSGGAALTAAIMAHDNGAKILLIERSNKIGGTTAMSGGGAWIPLNPHMQEIGVKDSREEALTYCKRLTAGRASDELVEAFVDNGHQMVSYLEKNTAVQFEAYNMPDYHAEFEGGKFARCIEAQMYEIKELGDWAGNLRTGMLPIPIGPKEVFEKKVMVRPLEALDLNVIMDRLSRGVLAGGPALIARLLKSCLDRGIDILLETRARELVQQDGRVAGLRAERDGGDLLVKAAAVVLACGGFEWNEALRKQFLTGPVFHHCSPPHSNEGDGLIMAMEMGADLGNMNEVWAYPGFAMPGEEYEGAPLSRWVIAERSLPHAIMVNRRGRRFVDESQNYNEVAKTLHHFDAHTYEFGNIPAWVIMDGQYRSKYPIQTVMTTDPDPDWLLKGETLAEVAQKAGIDAKALEATVARWNGFVQKGKDEDFERGETPYGIHWTGDDRAPHPNLGTVEKPPFYAMQVLPHSCGTKGGPRTNAKGQVINVRGAAIPGLYAAGNTAAFVSGPGYYGGGGTIGPGMTWGYLCGINAAKEAGSRKG